MKSVNSALLWRLGIIVLVPVVVVVAPLVIHSLSYSLYPETAAGLRFGIRLDHSTEKTCLVFRSDPAPDGLRKFLCVGRQTDR